MVECTLAKTLLIISGGREAVPGIAQAKQMGLHVIVSDGNPQAPGFCLSDDHLIVSTYDVEETVRQARQYHENIKNIDGVMCIAADVPYTVASVAKALHLPGISVESAALAMDKVAMKDRFRGDGIPIPDYQELFSYQDLLNVVKLMGFPLILKPVDSRGARGVLKLEPDIDLQWAWDHALGNSPKARVMVENYINGPQISTESMMIRGRCHTVGFADRNYELIDKYSPHIIENGGDLPSDLPLDLQGHVKQLVENAAVSMGISDGIVKGDIVIKDGKPVVIELAARLSGGYFCTHEIPFSTGINLVEVAINFALGQPITPEDLVPVSNHIICQRYLFPGPGKIKKIHGIHALKKNKNVKYSNFNLNVNDQIEPPTAHPSRPGMVITSGSSRLEAQRHACAALESIKIDYYD